MNFKFATHIGSSSCHKDHGKRSIKKKTKKVVDSHETKYGPKKVNLRVFCILVCGGVKQAIRSFTAKGKLYTTANMGARVTEIGLYTDIFNTSFMAPRFMFNSWNNEISVI